MSAPHSECTALKCAAKWSMQIGARLWCRMWSHTVFFGVCTGSARRPLELFASLRYKRQLSGSTHGVWLDNPVVLLLCRGRGSARQSVATSACLSCRTACLVAAVWTRLFPLCGVTGDSPECCTGRLHTAVAGLDVDTVVVIFFHIMTLSVWIVKRIVFFN